MIGTTSGARAFIGTDTRPGSGSPPFDPADDAYVEIGEVESLGEFGDDAPAVPASAVADTRASKLKGVADPGMIALIVGRDPSDPGQIALRAAVRSRKRHNFKVIESDGTTNYFAVMALSARGQYGRADDITKTQFNLAISGEIIEVVHA